MFAPSTPPRQVLERNLHIRRSTVVLVQFIRAHAHAPLVREVRVRIFQIRDINKFAVKPALGECMAPSILQCLVYGKFSKCKILEREISLNIWGLFHPGLGISHPIDKYSIQMGVCQ